jgi:hypothetical protein
VRFERKLDGAWRETPLQDVSTVVFSEAMVRLGAGQPYLAPSHRLIAGRGALSQQG